MASTQVIDLEGRTVLPGLIDGTLHGLRNGYACFSQQVRHDTVFSRQDALNAYAAKAKELGSGVWIYTQGGFNIAQFDKPGMFTLAELDAAMPDNPAFIALAGGFSGTQLNSRALKALGVADDKPTNGEVTVGVDANTKKLTGVMTAGRNALNKLVGFADYSLDKQVKCFTDFFRDANKRGLTGWSDPGGNDPFDYEGRIIETFRDNHSYQAVNSIWRQGKMPVRVVYHLTSYAGLPNVARDLNSPVSQLGDDYLRLGGIGEEVFASVPADNIYPVAEYQKIVDLIAQNRWQLEHHSTAEITNVTMMNAWEAANAKWPITDLNWGILHPNNPSVETLARLKKLNAYISPTDSSSLSPSPTTFRPYRRIYDSGVRMCLGSDAMNVAPYPPFVNLWYVTTGLSHVPNVVGTPADQRLNRTEALRSMTTHCADELFLANKIGSLQSGYYADLIVLSDDYFTVPDAKIVNITSVMTMIGGKVVYGEGKFASLVK